MQWKRLEVLRQDNFRGFWTARVSTSLAYQMLSVVVGWKMYELTASPFYLGLVGLAQFLPLLVFSLLVGSIVDRYDRRKIIRICQSVEAIGVLLLAIMSYNNWLNKENLLFIVFLIGAARAFESPALQALLPNLVPTTIFPQAVALSSSSMQTATIIGPALGGLLYVYGAGNVCLLISVLFFASSILIARLKPLTQSIRREPVSWQSIMAGVQFIFSKPVILGAISLDLFAVLLGGATALLPVYAKEILLIGPLGLGLLRSAPAVGALIMAIILAHWPIKHNAGRKMFAAVVVFGLMTVIFAFSQSIWLSLAALFFLGASDNISVVVRSSLVQLQTPDEMRGRVSAVNFVFIGTSNQLGEFESGMVAAFLGTVPAVAVGGVGTIIIAALWIKFFPQLYRLNNLAMNKQ